MTKGGSINRYTFKNLNEDETYIVKVRAVDQSGEMSGWLSQTFSLKHGKKLNNLHRVLINFAF